KLIVVSLHQLKRTVQDFDAFNDIIEENKESLIKDNKDFWDHIPLEDGLEQSLLQLIAKEPSGRTAARRRSPLHEPQMLNILAVLANKFTGHTQRAYKRWIRRYVIFANPDH